MDARSRRKCFSERSYSHDIVLNDKIFSTPKKEEKRPLRDSQFTVSSVSTNSTVTRNPDFRGKLSRTDSSIIVISRCAGNSSNAPTKPPPPPFKQNTPKKKNKPTRQNSVSSFFQKHFRGANNNQQETSGKSRKPPSVPNKEPSTGWVTGNYPVITKRPASSSAVREKPSGKNNSPLTSPNILGVPNIFTTAFSRSARFNGGADVCPDDIRLTEQVDLDTAIKKEYSKSTPELQDVTTESYGGRLDPSRRERRPSDDGSQRVTSLLQCNRYKDDYVCEILDYLYMGSIEAAYHEPLLCKLGIDSLIDISNIPAEKVPYHKKSDCPCMCTSRTRHLRAKLYVAVEDNPSENIEQYFSEINSFIEGVRRCGKRVLIYSFHGNSRAPTAVIQHLMTQQNLLLRQSFNLVKNQRPSIKLNPGFRANLEFLERKLFPGAKPSLSFENEFVNVANPQIVKTAWADC